MLTSRQRKTGFTIVELLIVIVVIAILAAISIVAYNGIQNRAKNSQLASVVDTYVKAIEMYHAVEGSYPIAIPNSCLGTIADYPETDQFDAGVCNEYNDAVNSTLNSELSEYLETIPDGSYPPINGGDGMSRGIVYAYNGVGKADLFYYLKGEKACPRGKTNVWRTGYVNCNIRFN